MPGWYFDQAGVGWSDTPGFRSFRMSRYLLISLCIGVGAALIASLAQLLGAFSPVSEALREAYTVQGIFLHEDIIRLTWLEILLTKLVALGVAWSIVDLPGLAQKGVVVLCSLILISVLSPVLALHHWLFDPSSSLLAVLLAALGGYAFSRTTLGMRRGRMIEVLGNRISHDKFLALLQRPEELPLEARRVEVSILSCRLLNHAEVQEKLSPKDWVAISNFFLRSVETFLIREGGYLDEAHPESLRACFGLLDENSSHEEEVCRVALLLQSRLRNLSRECETRWFQSLEFGIGIETGEVTAGVFGDRISARLSAVGKVNELAFRLAAANPPTVEGIVMGPELFSRVREVFALRPLEMFYDPARGLLHEVYHLLDRKETFSSEAQEGLDLYWKGIIYLREQRYEDALNAFSRSRAVAGYDPTVEYFVGRMQEELSLTGASELETRDESPARGHARLINRL